MSESSRKRAEEFLTISGQFKLGALVTEASHPVTANLSNVARQDIAAALGLLFDVDADVIRKYREFVASGRAGGIKETVLHSLKNGGRIFFTGCGATGRLSILLDSVWRDFWRQSRGRGNESKIGITKETPYVVSYKNLEDFENRTFSVMAGGDYALIKSVEGFEDFSAFGRKQIRDLDVRAGDVVFAITEGGETSFVIGTAWEGVDSGAKVYFVYNNPDEILCQHVDRSREIIEDPRIEVPEGGIVTVNCMHPLENVARRVDVRAGVRPYAQARHDAGVLGVAGGPLKHRGGMPWEIRRDRFSDGVRQVDDFHLSSLPPRAGRGPGTHRNASTGHASKQRPHPVHFPGTTRATRPNGCPGASSIKSESKKQSGGHLSHPMHFSTMTSAIGGSSPANGGGSGESPGYLSLFPVISRSVNRFS